MIEHPVISRLDSIELCNRYATPEPEFVWFDWGRDFAALVYPANVGGSYLLYVAGGEYYAFPTFASACDFIAKEMI